MLTNPSSTPLPVTTTPALSLPPTPGSDRSHVSPAGPIAGVLVGMMVVAATIAVVLLAILAQRRRQRKSLHELDSRDETVVNPIYAGSVAHVHGV